MFKIGIDQNFFYNLIKYNTFLHNRKVGSQILLEKYFMLLDLAIT